MKMKIFIKEKFNFLLIRLFIILINYLYNEEYFI